ncbi:MAG TPA: DUF2934 domain-containing protein [Terriglobales bacterium]|nr:DUF2934 domain-containing protein [Terriglobales bacterium]
MARLEQPTRPKELEAAIRKRASEIWEESGRIPGHDAENWLRAETEVLAQWASRQKRVAGIRVRVAETIYVAEYDPAEAGGYRPGEFKSGDPVELRFEGEDLYVKRAAGQELRARIVQTSVASR